MKPLAILSMTFVLAIAVIQTYAQEAEKAAVKDTKQELKSERKELRQLEGTKVNENAKNNFVSNFGNLPNVAWKRVDTYDQATFSKNGQKMTAFFDEDANLVGTVAPKRFADLPARGQKEIKTQYKDYTVGPVFFFDDNESNETDMIMYGTQFDDADNYFVELTKGTNKIVVEVSTDGLVIFFKKLS
jgi:hypothetical protein